MEGNLTALGRMLEGFVESNTVALKPMALNSTANVSAPPVELKPAAPPQEVQDLPLVLYIDNNPQASCRMEAALRSAGYRCIRIQDSVQALVQSIRHKPQMIFVSAAMPVASGYEICQQIRRAKAFCHTPIVILLDNDSLMARARAKSAGATTAIAKPIDPSTVVDMVRRELAVP